MKVVVNLILGFNFFCIMASICDQLMNLFFCNFLCLKSNRRFVRFLIPFRHNDPRNIQCLFYALLAHAAHTAHLEFNLHLFLSMSYRNGAQENC